MDSLPDDQQPADPAACPGSARVARDRQGIETAVWWRRLDSTRVHLVAARRDLLVGGVMVWGAAIPVDTLDRGPRDAQEVERGAYGCARPAPSVAVDSITGYVHVAYALAGPEGTGIFYAHQMDPRAAFEVPIAILYGDRLGGARVTADGNVVAVAYEDPNSRQSARVGVAISRTAGHLFDIRLAASVGSRDCRDPEVTVRGSSVTVGWSMRATPDAPPAFWQRQAQVQIATGS
jgi:hypothetical protein